MGKYWEKEGGKKEGKGERGEAPGVGRDGLGGAEEGCGCGRGLQRKGRGLSARATPLKATPPARDGSSGRGDARAPRPLTSSGAHGQSSLISGIPSVPLFRAGVIPELRVSNQP